MLFCKVCMMAHVLGFVFINGLCCNMANGCIVFCYDLCNNKKITCGSL